MSTDVLVTTEKQLALDFLQSLPATTTLKEIISELELFAALLESIAEADAGLLIPHEEVKRRMPSWRSQ